MNQKLKEIFRSRNAQVTLITLVSTVFAMNGVGLDQSPEEIYGLFEGQTLIPVIITLVVNFLNVLIKFVKNIRTFGFNTTFLMSPNFWTQVITMLSIVLTVFIGEEQAMLVVAIAGNIVNFLFHAGSPAKYSA